MDPLVGTVIGIVSPYLVKGAEEFAKSAGSEAFKGAQKLAARLSQWWAGEPVADAAVKALPSDPERYAKVLGNELAYELEKNPAFGAELRGLVNGMGTSVEVVQKMEIARGVTGADIGKLMSGAIRVQQDIRDAADVAGYKGDIVGGS